ncbi:unnamed protein product [Lactuca virosa]|uniref:J domain-containing protein n=1 Tax=Lactuca virosa TaxID=75947 RepID=A0AAU9M943_9ASTR|nr:unnamed protein product [Lactuca virosa]
MGGSKMEEETSSSVDPSAVANRTDPYDVLNVSRDSSDQEIKSAYRNLALKLMKNKKESDLLEIFLNELDESLLLIASNMDEWSSTFFSQLTLNQSYRLYKLPSRHIISYNLNIRTTATQESSPLNQSKTSLLYQLTDLAARRKIQDLTIGPVISLCLIWS